MKIIQTQLLILILQFVVFALIIPNIYQGYILLTMLAQFIFCLYKAFTAKSDQENIYQNYFIAAILIPTIGLSICSTFVIYILVIK